MLVPVITSTGTPASSSTFNTPMWASPRAAPPERATPTFWPRAPHSGNVHAASTRANRFTVCPIEESEGLKTVASARQSGRRARRNGTKHTICIDFREVRVRWEELRAMIRRRSFDRRENLGRRMVRDRRREQEPPEVERRSGKERRSGIVRRSGEERRSARQGAVVN